MANACEWCECEMTEHEAQYSLYVRDYIVCAACHEESDVPYCEYCGMDLVGGHCTPCEDATT